ncbi:MAG: ABC transporter permease [Deltaproteobacteria bacterium]|nr:MAG: ABC transporter permease [Deltaproteobacteria bacterium]
MHNLWQDVRYGLRTFRARPGFTAGVVITLALGIGANTAIFSAFNAILLRPLPVADLDRLVFGLALREGFDPFGTSFLDYALYRDARSLASSGLATQRPFHLLHQGEPERVVAAAVTASYLTTLGVKPVAGRLFTADEDRPGGPAVALLGHALWQRLFASDPASIGRAVELDGTPYSIVGVLPPAFDAPFSAQLWIPLQVRIDALPFDQRAATAHEFVARLKPGVRLDQADAELKQLARRLEQEHPQVRQGWSFGLIPLRRQYLADLDGRSERLLLVLGVAVGFLLLICCANVASLLLARGVSRETEIAIRRSLGAGRGRILQQLLTESLLLAFAGGGAGVLLAFWLLPGLGALTPIQATALGPWLTDFRIDGRVLLFSLAITVLTGSLFGLAPALKAAGSNGLMSAIKRAEHHAGAGKERRRSLSALVVGEVALAATLLVGGGLVAQSFHRLQSIDLGFRPDGLLTMELPLSPAKYRALSQQVDFIDQVLQRVRTLPGVLAAGITTNVPMQRGTTLDSVFEVEGHAPPRPSEVPITAHRAVSPGYAEALGVTLLEGRLLDANDQQRALPVAVVSAELVRQSWPGEDPPALPLNLVVRTEGNSGDVAASVRASVRAVDSSQPIANVMPLREQLTDLLIGERFSAVLMTVLAAMGLLLAALGLYGVIAYSVGQRKGEIGLRMALGAGPRDILRLVIGEGAWLVGAGLALGAAGGWVLTRLLETNLYGVSSADPATFMAVAVLLSSVALLACFVPARRASRIEPMAALRSE